MEILNTQDYISEKYKIKPLTKERLKKVKTGDGVHAWFEPYDIVSINNMLYMYLTNELLVLYERDDFSDCKNSKGVLYRERGKNSLTGHMRPYSYNVDYDYIGSGNKKIWSIKELWRLHTGIPPITKLDILNQETLLNLTTNGSYDLLYFRKINEKYQIKPLTKERLKNIKTMETVVATDDNIGQLVLDAIKEYGNEANLNFIDTSGVTNMEKLFLSLKFNGDISQWDVSNVTTMSELFRYSKFNGDISKWDVSNVKDMGYMFRGSDFNGDISKWNVSNVEDMISMFENSKFKGDISNWDVSNVKNMTYMFYDSSFNGDISQWNVSKVKYMNQMFDSSPLKNNPPKWYKE